MAMSGEPLAESLGPLIRAAVAQTKGEPRAAFYMVEATGAALFHLTGMSEAYARFVEKSGIGADALACGLATHIGEPVITADVEEDPRWESQRWLAREHGFRACWCFPVRTSGGPVLGTFAMYFGEPREPSAADVDLASVLAHAAAVIISRHTEAIERAQAQQALSAELEASSILHQISTELIREGSEQEIYERILDAALAIMRSDCASMQMLHSERGVAGELRLIGHRGFGPEAAKFWEWVGVGSGSSSGTLDHFAREIVRDVETCDYIAASEHLKINRQCGIRSLQRTALSSRSGRLLGRITTHWKLPHEPSERDLRLFDILARQAADVIERTHAVRALREADRRKDEFLATLAHELRNPLAPIRYGAMLARQRGCLPQQREEAVKVIERQATHMARLLDDLLDVSRITRGSLELRLTRTELDSVVSAAIEAARPLISARGHTLMVDLPQNPVRLEADPVRVTQIFSNLLTNAAKYTGPGGHILLAAREEADAVSVTVRDDGIGIAPDMIPKLFLIFSQAKPALERAEGGLGIGLALVRGLVELHGGTIEARSDGVDRGSEFIVRLPTGSATRRQGHAADRAEPRLGARPLKVLVADDNRDGANICAMLLRTWGHDVRCVYSGATAVEIAKAFRPHVLLLDIGMPELNGYEVAERVRTAPWSQGMVLIAVTGWGQQADKERALAAGFDHHVTKPADPELLDSLLVAVSSRLSVA